MLRNNLLMSKLLDLFNPLQTTFGLMVIGFGTVIQERIPMEMVDGKLLTEEETTRLDDGIIPREDTIGKTEEDIKNEKCLFHTDNYFVNWMQKRKKTKHQFQHLLKTKLL